MKFRKEFNPNVHPYTGDPKLPTPTGLGPVAKGRIELQTRIMEHMHETEKITKLLKDFKTVNQTLKGSSIMQEMITEYTTILDKMKHQWHLDQLKIDKTGQEVINITKA